jgi:hypothetical protein
MKELGLSEVSPGNAASLMELRWDNRRVAGPYDVFLQLANQNVGTPVPISDVDAAGTVKRVADVLSRNA